MYATSVTLSTGGGAFGGGKQPPPGEKNAAIIFWLLLHIETNVLFYLCELQYK